MEAPPPAGLLAAEGASRFVLVRLCRLHLSGVVGRGACGRDCTTFRILGGVLILDLFVRDADTLGRGTYPPTTGALTRDEAVRECNL
jgi:hypothetical protein